MKKIFFIIFSVLCLFIGGVNIYVKYILSLNIPLLPTSLVILDINNTEIGEIIAEDSIRHRTIHYEDIPDFYLSGIVWLEDRSFWENGGVSFKGIGRSIMNNTRAGKVVEGASTITAQYIRNALWINEKRDITHKILESIYAIRLTHLLSKQDIITAYVNRISFGYLNYGLRSASLYYFNKEPKNLTKAEQIALIVIPKNPSKYDPYRNALAFRNRYTMILDSFERGGLISEDEVQSIRSEKLMLNYDHKPQLPYVIDFIQSEKHNSETGGIIKTTIDSQLTHRIDTLAREVLEQLSWRNVSDYGVLIAERTSAGPVLRVMIGGKDYHETKDGQVNTTLSLRQPGSTLKPFTYLLAFQVLGLTPESTITDLPIQFKTALGYSYEPKNYSQEYQGEVTLREALSQSINIPAIKLLDRIGTKTLLDFLHRAGIKSLDKDADYYGLALTLGDGEVTLFELLQAYSIFAYQGEFCRLVYIQNDSNECNQVTDQKYTDMIVSILSDRYAKLDGFPINSALDFPDRWVALKTGTSRNFRDNWTVGFTEHYMIGVWTGNKSGENMKGVSGATGAGEIFSRIVYALEKNETTPIIVERKPKSEPFLNITNPLSGSVYKIDATKPESTQKIALSFQTNILYDSSYWIIDGKKSNESLYTIAPGKHILEVILVKNGNIIEKKMSEIHVEE